MGEYRSEDESLVGVARELAYAYIDAAGDEDADYAADEIWEFLFEREALPGEALVALLDLPADARTRGLLERVTTTLRARGAEVVPLLLAALLPDAAAVHRAEHAAAVMDGMVEGELVTGLVNVLASRAGDELKAACVAALVALGEPCLHALESMVNEPLAAPWARDALDELRGGRTAAVRLQIDALEAVFAAEAYEPAKPAAEGGDAEHAGAEGDGDER